MKMKKCLLSCFVSFEMLKLNKKLVITQIVVNFMKMTCHSNFGDISGI